jgi:hypothetical protein
VRNGSAISLTQNGPAEHNQQKRTATQPFTIKERTMKYLRIMMTTALLLSTSVASASAGVPKILPEPTEASPVLGSGTAGKISFETASGTKLECEKATGTGEFTGPNDGQGEAHVTGCKALGFSCNSPGAKSGEILLKDTIHYWSGFLGKELIAVAVALITKNLVIECTALVKMEKRGCTAGQVPPASLNKKIKSVTGTLKQTKGKQEITEVLAPKSEKVIKCVGEISKNGGAFEEIGQEGSATTEGFKQNGKALEVELMF